MIDSATSRLKQKLYSLRLDMEAFVPSKTERTLVVLGPPNKNVKGRKDKEVGLCTIYCRYVVVHMRAIAFFYYYSTCDKCSSYRIY